MKSSLVLTFSGPDRPGIVEALSKVVTAHGGNWERGRLARLAGRFAGIVEVRVEPSRVEALASELERISGLRVAVEPAGPPAEEKVHRLLQLELTGQDREGIVHEVARALAERGINVEELTTESSSAPMSGEPLFFARAQLQCPVGVDVVELRRALGALSQELMVDISLGERNL